MTDVLRSSREGAVAVLELHRPEAKNSLDKDAALRTFETSLSQGLEHEKRNFHVAVQSADSREGQAAFLTKRPPQFTGK